VRAEVTTRTDAVGAGPAADTPVSGGTGMQAGRRADMTAYARYTREALGSLSGTVLEIGAGCGANFSYLAAGIDWIGLEPDPAARRRLATVAAAHGYHRPVMASVAERIPLPDASVDAVAGTSVLCSVADQAMVLAQVRRVLRPGGQFVFFEHVAAPRGTISRGLQRCCAPLSRHLAAGCDPARRRGGRLPRPVFATSSSAGSARGLLSASTATT
jgi:SAM-dependent methyltransferase